VAASVLSFALFAALLTITPGLDTMFVVRTAALILGAVHDVEGMIRFGVLILVVRSAATWFARADVRRCLDRITVVVFVGFGLRLALQRGS
jgi:threonine/homoserine/homoserine lactone efflux protein